MAAFISAPSDIDKRPALQDDDEDVPEDKYEGVACPASLVALLNRKTGKLGQNRE
jgi:hypothetical protein